VRDRNLLVTAALVAALSASGCAATTIDSSVTEAPAVAVTTTLPTGTAAELLPRLVTEAGKLSDVIGSSGDKGDQLLVITDLYDAIRPEIAENDGVAAESFDAAIELCRRGTQFNRPADADKCFRNLSALADAYLA
jgi:hypothetical protein